MEKLEKETLQITKEIMVKFIETQRVSPGNFGEVFPAVCRTVTDTILQERRRLGQEPAARPERGGKPAQTVSR
jgi:hypothetical protein